MSKLSDVLVDPTGYLQEKKLDFALLSSLIGLRVGRDWWYGDCLEYPLVNVNGQITGYERIYPRGLLHKHCPDRFAVKDNKKVTKGTKVSQSFALVGISHAELPKYLGCLRIVGGMADALNVYLATGEPVVCIVGENNARSIAVQLTNKWPHLAHNLVIALDHDLPGIMACHRAGFRWVIPQRYGEDWSDVRLDAGFQGLKRQLQWVRKPILAINLKSVPVAAVEMAKDNFCGDYRSALKLLAKTNNEQFAGTLAEAIVSRFHHRVPAQCGEHDFIKRIQAANPYLLHPDTLNQLKRQLSCYCFRQQQVIQRECGLSSGKRKSLGEFYHAVSAITPQTVSLEKGRITLVKAPYGSGKTKLMSALSQSAMQKGERILAITHLVSLAHELAKRQGLESYLDTYEFCMASINRLVTCINSLCAPNVSRFLETGKTDILLLDEFSQHISVLGTSPHIKDPSVLARYLDLIEQTPTVIICDADLSSYHVGLLQEWFPEREIHFYEMPYSRDVTLACQFATGKTQAKSVIDQQLLPSVAQGRKIAIATDSRAYAGKLEKIIRKQHPDISMLLFHGKNRNEPDQIAFQKNFDQEAQRYQVIIYTPAIESGVSIQTPFDQVFGFSHNVVLPTKFVQMLRRFRSAQQFTVVADLIPGKKDNEDWLARVRALQYAQRYVRNTDGVTVGEYDGFCEAERSRQVKLKALGGNGLFYLMQNRGFAMEYYQGKQQSESFDLCWKATEEEVEKEERAAIQQSPIVSASQYDELSHKVEPRLQEICSCERYRICEELGIEPVALKGEILSSGRRLS
ncbi:plasmid replication protein, CyRepA1 family [Endozoicomonas sp. ISHI1]|uniref:plasmid replication protein, CyRepA1 family n=1 Tax=Endozoicomonas sp. ISHI1 TaxID=2825882 RepID=UPI002148C95A|nr:plasmid replication protein, CyRepA1 family [Endozoicomonas sp. ISHI1]